MPAVDADFSNPIVTKSGIKWFMQTTYRERWARDGNQTTVIAFVAWDDTATWLADMLGWSQLLGYQRHRSLPEKNPYAPSQVCTECNLSDAYGNHSFDVAYENWIRFDYAVYACTFSAPLYVVKEDDEVDAESDRYCIWRRKLSGRNQIIPGCSFQTIDDAVPTNRLAIGQTTTILQKEIRYTCEWLQLPAIPDGVESCLGCINNAAFTFVDLTGSTVECPAYTLLFEDCDDSPHRDATGAITTDLTLTFKKKVGFDKAGTALTWRLLPRKDRTYIEVSTNGQSSGDRPFLDEDFSKIFTFP